MVPSIASIMLPYPANARDCHAEARSAIGRTYQRRFEVETSWQTHSKRITGVVGRLGFEGVVVKHNRDKVIEKQTDGIVVFPFND